MRLRIVFEAGRPISLPINYQEYLGAAVYALLECSSVDYARFLHDEGYAFDAGPKRFKLFTYSWLRGRRLTANEGAIRFGAEPLEWFVASPLPDFLQHLATGLLATGHVQAGPATLPIASVEALAEPVLAPSMQGTCLSPIVAAVPDPRGTRYLRAGDGDAFSDAVRRNLLRKHQTLHGKPPVDDRFILTFAPAYITRSPHAGAKKITTHGIDVIGVLAPFTVSGSEELLRIGLDCGLGEKNASGFGMVELSPTRP